MTAFILLLLIGGVIAGYLYLKIFSDNVEIPDSTAFIQIPTGTNLSELTDILEDKGLVKDLNSFQFVSKLMKFKTVKPGRYQLKDGWNNRELVSILRSGRQTPINVTINNFRTLPDLCGFFGSKFEQDSISFLKFLQSTLTEKKNTYTKENQLTLFLPNSYEFYWNTSPQKLLERFTKEHDKFYNSKRQKLLKKLNMTKEEVYTLASIVQKETLVNAEKPRVAGVYINRLNRGQLLQADPTVVFANGDFTIRRVLNKHLAKDSPYNTYKYEGLPPGPICMPDVSSIDAVLNYEKHKYLYFCASTDNSGRHQFAKTLKEHNRNANRYRAYLNKQRIFK